MLSSPSKPLIWPPRPLGPAAYHILQCTFLGPNGCDMGVLAFEVCNQGEFGLRGALLARQCQFYERDKGRHKKGPAQTREALDWPGAEPHGRKPGVP